MEKSKERRIGRPDLIFMKTSRFTLNKMLLLFSMIPLFFSVIFLLFYSSNKLVSELEENTYTKLSASSTQVKKYFEWDINEDILEKDEVSEGFIDSLKDQNIELTLFKKNKRWLTSVLNQDGERMNDTECDPKVWETVQQGKNYVEKGVPINGDDYFVSYTPVYDKNGNVWGMAFAGEKETIITSAKRQMLIGLVLISLILVVVFVVIVLIMAKKVSRPINQVTDAVKDTSEGNLSADTNIRSILSETISLIHSAKALQDVLLTIIGKTTNISHDLEIDATEINRLITNNKESIDNINIAMEEIAKGSVAMADNVQNINEQILDMGRNIDGVSENTAALLLSSDNIKKSNAESSDYINEVSDKSQESVEAVRKIHKQILETNDAINEILEVMELLANITRQTNLLALNASIEAARVGEQGKGFAVVAREIKELSEESNTSTEQIKSVINRILDKSKQNIETSEKVVSVIDMEQELIAKTQDKFEILNEEITESLEQISQISGSVELLNQSKASIVDSISDLSAITEENAASCQETSSSLHEISESMNHIEKNAGKTKNMAAELGDTIRYFHS